MKTYNLRTCPVCGKEHSCAGFVTAAHNRKHVREGRLVEIEKWSFPFRATGFRVERRFILPADLDRFIAKGWSRRPTTTKEN